jgi:hypothetical protein
VLHVSYVSTAGSLRHYWTSGAGWSSETVLNVSSICAWDRVPVMGTFGSQLHILARCLGNWLHFWQDPGGPWANEYLGVSATPADAEIALATTGDEFIVAGNATDGTLWRWWYTSGVGWREERVANQAAVGRIQVGYFFGSLHVAWSSGAAHNSWINGSSWSDESHICTSSCNDLDSIAVGSTYYILTPSRMLGRWNGSWTWFA